MLQTLYRVADPTVGPATGAEFYEVFLDARPAAGKTAFFVVEKHGWWDEAEKRPKILVTTLCPEEGVSTYDEALAIYQRQVQRRVSDGFVHSYSPDFYSNSATQFVYRNLRER